MRVSYDDDGVLMERSDGEEERVTWKSLRTVLIQTTDDGPMAEDFFIVLLGDDETGCVIPQGARGSEKLLEHLQALPGFNYEAVIEASESVVNNRFICWERPK